MATWETVCEIVRALPGTELDTDRQGRPTWRVDGRPILRRFPRLGVRDEEALLGTRGEVLAIGAEPGLREALLQQDPNTFFVTLMWAKRHAVLVWLESIAFNELQELIIDAWQRRASRARLDEAVSPNVGRHIAIPGC
jgi:hypothetical protein